MSGPDPESAGRLAEATRRVIDVVRPSKAPAAAMCASAEALDAVTAASFDQLLGSAA